MEIVGGWESGMSWESSADIYTLQRKIDSLWEPAVKHRKLSSVPCDDLEGRNGCGKGGSRRRGYSLHSRS